MLICNELCSPLREEEVRALFLRWAVTCLLSQKWSRYIVRYINMYCTLKLLISHLWLLFWEEETNVCQQYWSAIFTIKLDVVDTRHCGWLLNSYFYLKQKRTSISKSVHLNVTPCTGKAIILALSEVETMCVLTWVWTQDINRDHRTVGHSGFLCLLSTAPLNWRITVNEQ